MRCISLRPPHRCCTGGLGLMVARWVVQHAGAAYICLLSRSGRPSDARAAAALAATAACVTSAMADAGALADARSTLGAARTGPALQAVLHASGVLADAMIDKQSASSFR